MGDDQDVDLTGTIVNPIDQAPVAHPVAQTPGESAGETLHVVVMTRVVLKLPETARQLAGKGRISQGEESPGLGRRISSNIRADLAPLDSLAGGDGPFSGGNALHQGGLIEEPHIIRQRLQPLGRQAIDGTLDLPA